MHAILENLVHRLHDRQFLNEEAIKQGVVLRLLDALNWDIYDPLSVRAEFSIGGRRVDYALCHPHEKPRIFVEVKQKATFDAGEDQLMMRYAFQHGVPIAVLTDGQRWAFYLPGGEGTFQERCFYHLDLLERDTDEAQKRLVRYLDFERVKNGKAIEAARSDLDSAARNRAVIKTLPAAWEEMLGEGDEILCLALIERVQTLTGFRPELEEAFGFITGQASIPSAVKSPIKLPRPVAVPNSATKSIFDEVSAGSENKAAAKAEGDNWFAVNGAEVLRSKQAIKITVAALRECHALIPNFLGIFHRERAAQTVGRKTPRRWLAKEREDLYDKPHLAKNSTELADGWWLGTNYTNGEKREMLELAKQIATRHGIELSFHLQ